MNKKIGCEKHRTNQNFKSQLIHVFLLDDEKKERKNWNVVEIPPSSIFIPYSPLCNPAEDTLFIFSITL